MLILVCLGELPRLTLYAVWILPLIFTIFNTSPAQLLFPILPDLMAKLLQWTDIFRTPGLWARMLVVIPWQVAGWWMVVRSLSKRTSCTGMKIDLSLADGISLQIASGTNRDASYPTGKMQKGLVLFCDGQDLSEEAVGFGVPILKRGLQTVFPGEVELYPDAGNSPNKFTARYKLNLEEKIARPGSGSINNRLVYASKNMLAGMIRGLPAVRRLLTNTSNLLRSTFGWQTTYEPAGYSTYVTLTYTIDAGAGTILVELMSVDSIPDGITEIILMNEQGAHHFDQYQDADGTVDARRRDWLLGRSYCGQCCIHQQQPTDILQPAAGERSQALPGQRADRHTPGLVGVRLYLPTQPRSFQL